MADHPGLRLLRRLTQPWLSRRTPVLYDLSKLALRVFCPRGRWPAGKTIEADVRGGRMELDLSASLEYTLFFRGCHEPHIARVLAQSAKPGDVCLDVGANVGAHTLVMAAAVGHQGRVFSLEPHPVIGARLERNVALNRLTQVEVLPVVLTDTDGEVEFFGFEEGAFQQGMSSLLRGEGASHVLRVEALTGKSLMERCATDRLDLVKIDVEGAESIVLAQLRPWIEQALPHLVFEHRAHHWERAEWSLSEVLVWLRGLGYALHVVRKAGMRPLDGDPPPSCEILCVPATRRRPTPG